MRLAFLGTPEAAVPALRALVAAGHEVEVVITRPDRRRGRGSATSPSPVKAAAQELGLRVEHRLSELEGLDLELGVVVAYGAMIPVAVLERLPMVNVHFSLLPRWRGAAPVERAILAGDEETGVGVMVLEETLDTGPVLAERRTLVDDKTASGLTSELAELGAALLVEVLARPDWRSPSTAQRGTPVYAAKLSAETFHLTPEHSVADLARLVRLDRAFTVLDGRRVRVLRAHACATRGLAGSVAIVDGQPALVTLDGALVLDEVQPEGARVMLGSSWMAGARLAHDATWA